MRPSPGATLTEMEVAEPSFTLDTESVNRANHGGGCSALVICTIGGILVDEDLTHRFP